MTGAGLVLQVARWEFQRYFKLRQQIVGIVLVVLSGLGVTGIMRLADRDDPVEIAVIGMDVLPLGDDASSDLRLVEHPPDDLESLREDVRRGEREALLLIHNRDSVELFTSRQGGWISDLREALAAARQQDALQRANLSPQTLAEVLATPELVVRDSSGEADGLRTGRFALVVVLSIMLFTVFMGMSYLFASITGEKQLRVTEQVIAAIPAQTWMDGKILGLAAVSAGGVAATGIGVVAVVLILQLLGSSFPFPLPSFGDPVTVAVIVAFGTLGLFFWFAFLAVIAAVIDDPNTSSRSSLLFVPMLATALGFLALGNPDSLLVRTLALLPPTSPAAMPARMLVGSAGPIEIALSIALLAAAVVALRTAAGRVFRLAMLMYGKEPGWNEVRRWITSA